VLALVLDTSSEAVTAAVVDVSGEPEVRGARVTLNARGHGELLAPSIAGALADAGSAVTDLAAVVAGVGPGPYTGLRVGLVSAAVIADARGIPAYGVCSLDAIGDACRAEPDLLVATDARRREVYWARYRHGVRTAGPGVDRPTDIDVTGCTAVAGHGATLYEFGLARRDVPHPPPVALARCARDRIAGRAPSEVLVPLYLRRPDAVVPAAPKPVSP
jgi:tRNA threonylcarbamoyl adenosine modification protein YeaZ